MKSIKMVMLAAVAVLALSLAGTASATRLDPAGATITGVSTSSTLTTPSGNVTCTRATAHGTITNAGSTGNTNWVGNNVDLKWGTDAGGSCSAFGLSASVVLTPANCAVLEANYNHGSPIGRVQLPAGCHVVINAGFGTCQITIGNGATIGNATYNNATGTLLFAGSSTPFTRVSGFAPCPASGVGQYDADYTLTPRVTVTH